jgi:RNA polymerase sigma factor (sigma-70 family)
MDEPSDAQLLAGCANRDQEAATALVERVHPLLVRIARAHHPRELQVEDLVQDIVLKMFQRLPSYQARAGIAFSHWLSRLAVNTCLDAIRSQDRRSRRERLPADQQRFLEALVDDRAQPAEEAFAARELVQRLLASLPPRDALLLTLLDLEGRSIAEVALTTGWNRTLIKVRAFRARGRLRALASSLADGGRRSAAGTPTTTTSPPAAAAGARDVEL